MKYSVIVPVYNVENYLSACFASVLEQTYRNFELILIDDGSTDSSGMLCDVLARENPDKVFVVHQVNAGVLAARRHGITIATGDVVVFLDSDDCLRQDALMQLEAVFEREHCDIVIYNASPSMCFSPSYHPHMFENGTCFEGESKRKLYECMVISSALNPLCFKAIKKNVADMLPDYSQWLSVTHGEDLLCSLPLVTNAKRIVYLAQNLYFYRQRQGSAVHSFSEKRYESIKAVHTEFTQFIDVWNMPELHRLHNARKVKGCVETAEMALLNRKCLGGKRYRSVLKGIAEDPYFLQAYADMDAKYLKKRNRLMAFCLYKKLYFVLDSLASVKTIYLKIKSHLLRRKHAR